MIDEDGYVYIMGRTDDVVNVAGHRLSTGAIEEVLSALPDGSVMEGLAARHTSIETLNVWKLEAFVKKGFLGSIETEH